MDRRLSCLKVLFLSIILLFAMFCSCVEDKQKPEEKEGYKQMKLLDF